ncbi:MAG: RNA polymerase sigma factor [Nitrospirae bacterium]|nr:MAG: RNA polymerase sigma factor [Nitrospirota bacterium]
MLRFQRGDEDGFVELFRRHHHPMARYLYRFTGSEAVAEELVQETFLRIHRARATYTPRARWRTWAYRIATNVALNHLRRAERAAEHVAAGEEGEPERVVVADPRPEGADRRAEAAELARRLAAALAELPEAQRTAFLLSRLEGFGYKEVAEVLETTVPAVKSLVFRARDHLRRAAADLLPEAYR